MLHFVANSPWSDQAVLAKSLEMVLPEIERHGPIKVWIIDDTGFPKQGEHSVGVKHQYCGQLGKQANCIPTIKVQAVLRQGKLGTRMSAKSLALKLPKHVWRTITWREGTNKVLRSRFARVQVRTAPIRRAAERPEETLLIEWPEGEDAPTKYWLSTV